MRPLEGSAARTGSARGGRLLWVIALVAQAMLGGVAAARNLALLIAVGQFGDPLLNSEQLLGTAPDIESVQRTLTEHWRFAAGDVRTLRDREATHARILEEITALEGRSARGDTVLVYFSGHGTSANADNNGFDLPYATGAWVPYDVDVTSVATAQRTLIIGRRDLVPRLKRLDEGGRLVLVISDSCYSGQVVRAFGQTHALSRYLHLVTRDGSRDLGVARVGAAAAAPRPPPPPYPYQHVLLLSAASDSESGADISSPLALQQAPTLDGRYHGAFTDALLRLLAGQLLPGTFNYAQAQQALSAFLEHRHFAQHPQLLPAIAEDPLNIGATAFLGMQPAAPAGAAAAAAVPATPIASARDARVHVRLETVSAELRARIAALDGIALVDEGADLTVRQRAAEVTLTGPAGDPIATTTAGDPSLLKRLAAQVWLKRALPVTSDTLGLRAETDPGSRGNTYVQCESFVFEVRLQQPAYVMLLDLDSQGALTVLYPTRASERAIVPAAEARAIPSADPRDRIVVTPPFGTDEVTVLAFERLPAFFAELTGAQRFDISDARAAQLSRGLAASAGAVSARELSVHTYAASSGLSCIHSGGEVR